LTVTDITFTGAPATVVFTTVEPTMLPTVADIVALPEDTAVTVPFEAASSLTVAIVVADELQEAEPVRFWLLLSENVPVAVNNPESPTSREELAGVTVIDTSVGAEAVAPPPSPPPPHPVIAAINTRRVQNPAVLANFIEVHSFGDQFGEIGTPLQVAHMSPGLHDKPL